MSGLLSLRPERIFADPTGSAVIVIDSLARNVTAEGRFYGLLFIAIALGLTTDALRRRNLFGRYTSRGVRLDAFYGLLDLLHVMQFTVTLPASLLIARSLQTWAPWLKIDALANLPGWAQLLALFVLTDLNVYWWHRLQHRSEVVWQFHKTHHSQVELNLMTTYRVTAIDRVVALVALALPAAIIQADYAMPVAIAAALQFHQLVVHSDSGWSFGPLDRLFVSPSFHEVHHSTLESHLDKNYGGVLSIWDHLFGTFVQRGDRELVYGLVDERLPETYFRQQLVPVIGLRRLFRERTCKTAMWQRRRKFRIGRRPVGIISLVPRRPWPISRSESTSIAGSS